MMWLWAWQRPETWDPGNPDVSQWQDQGRVYSKNFGSTRVTFLRQKAGEHTTTVRHWNGATPNEPPATFSTSIQWRYLRLKRAPTPHDPGTATGSDGLTGVV
jgi:hypothetical protein